VIVFTLLGLLVAGGIVGVLYGVLIAHLTRWRPDVLPHL
jgi:hypothetical protein